MKNMRKTKSERALSTAFPEHGFVTDAQIAVFVGVHAKTIWDWAKPERGILPRPIKLSPSVTRWKAEEVRESLDRQARA